VVADVPSPKTHSIEEFWPYRDSILKGTRQVLRREPRHEIWHATSSKVNELCVSTAVAEGHIVQMWLQCLC
jgi:hypothetical protein